MLRRGLEAVDAAQDDHGDQEDHPEPDHDPLFVAAAETHQCSFEAAGVAADVVSPNVDVDVVAADAGAVLVEVGVTLFRVMTYH